MNKKLLSIGLILTMGAMMFAGCGKEEDTKEEPKTVQPTVAVENKSTALFLKTSGTKCPPCGGWGWQVSEGVISENQDAGTAYYLGIFSANFVSEGFITPTANDMDAKWGISSWPSFFVAGNKITPSGTVANVITMVQDEIDAFTEEKPIANTGVKYTVADGKMMIQSSLQFFKAAEGNYNVAFYVVENDAMWKQSGHATGATAAIPHHYVLRGAANGTWGETQATGPIAAGMVKNDIKAEMVIDPSWKMEKVAVYAVIWEKKGTKYEFVNVSKSK